MRWFAYINTKVDSGVWTRREHFELSMASPSDSRYAALRACEMFKAKEDMILCLPCCTYKCDLHLSLHSKECNDKYNVRPEPAFTPFDK